MLDVHLKQSFILFSLSLTAKQISYLFINETTRAGEQFFNI